MSATAAQKSESPTTKVDIQLQGRDYTVACGTGEEKKLEAIVRLVNEKLDGISQKGTLASETRSFMLACLVLADELIETRRIAKQTQQEDEALMVAAVNHLCDRIQSISEKVGK
ncbi:MAG: cell division protein ZapA [Proteobacteria bacterium]|jgi:cell division protein ZapA|nr:cell division protein ZapA [Alphaproteobacteria bacterium]NCC04047.1 cell division protein ZapA [Pseudomonadota bacterium]